MDANNKKFDVRRMVRLAVLAAIIVLMAFTPLGFFKTAGVEITFIQIPVVVGAIIMGPSAGAILGAFFGAVSFIQCFGMSAFGAVLLATNPLGTFLTCMTGRIYMGWLAGLLFKKLNAIDRTKLVSYGITGIAGPLMNTVFFLGYLVACFNDTMLGWANDAGKSLFPFLISFVGINGLIEACVCFVASTAIAKALDHFMNKN